MNFRIKQNLRRLSAAGGGKNVQLLLKHSGKMASSFHILGVSSSSVTLSFFHTWFECLSVHTVSTTHCLIQRKNSEYMS